MKSSPPTNSTTSKSGARTVEINTGQAGQRIDNYLITQLKGVPRSRVYKLLRSGQVRVNSGRKKPHYKLKAGDTVRIPPVSTTTSEKPVIPDTVKQLLSEAVLFENDDLLILNKPSGLAVHSGSGLSFGVIEALKNQYPEQFLELAHRLDRETSGCLLIAKNRPALVQLHELLKDKKEAGIGKYYLALVKGFWSDAVTIEAPLKKIMRGGEHMVEVDAEGQHAISHFEPVEHYPQATLVRVKIDTGRTHQIRVHAAHAGHPIAGDNKYGDNEFNRELKTAGLKRLFLHAERVEIPALEPGSNAPIIMEASIDDELQRVLDKLSE